MRVLQGLHKERLLAIRPRMFLLQQSIHLLVHMLLIGRVIWPTHHSYVVIVAGIDVLHRVILLHVITIAWNTGAKLPSTLLGPPSSRRSPLSPGITGGANNCRGGVVVFIPSWGYVVVGVLTADSTRRRPLDYRSIQPLQSASRLGVLSSSPPYRNGGAKSSWPGLTLAK